MFFKERAAASKRKYATASARKCAADNFMCVAASGNILMFFNKRADTSEKVLTTGSERKNMQLLLRIMTT